MEEVFTSLPVPLDPSSGWDWFLYVFSTISAAGLGDINGLSLSVESKAYWAAEAVAVFLVLSAAAVGNAYFWLRPRLLARESRPGRPGLEAQKSWFSVSTRRQLRRNSTQDTEPSADDDDGIERFKGTVDDESPCAHKGGDDGEHGDEDKSQGQEKEKENEGDDSPANKGCFGEGDEGEANGLGPLETAVDEENQIGESTLEDQQRLWRRDRIISQRQKSVPFRRRRLLYLDNVKIACIIIVFWHHTAEVLVGILCPPPEGSLADSVLKSFLTINRAWFMQLFFFVSAYFVRPVLAKKGPAWFIEDKTRRLGLPMLAITACVAPLRNLALASIAGRPYAYSVNFGVTWFLMWLQIFNFAYLVKNLLGKAPSAGANAVVRGADLPSDGRLLSAGLALGLVQGLIAYAQGGRWLAWGFLKIQWAYAPAHALSFAAGVAAERGGWLYVFEEGRTMWRVMGPASFAAAAGLATVASLGEEAVGGSALATCLVWGVCSGIMNVSFVFVVFEAAKLWADVRNKKTQFLSRAAYSFYLTHLNLVFVLAGCWVALANVAAGRPPLDWSIENLGFGWFVGGGVFITVVGMPLAWALSSYLCKVPGLKNIL